MAYRKASAKRRPPCRKTDPSKSKNLQEGVGPLIFRYQLSDNFRNEYRLWGALVFVSHSPYYNDVQREGR